MKRRFGPTAMLNKSSHPLRGQPEAACSNKSAPNSQHHQHQLPTLREATLNTPYSQHLRLPTLRDPTLSTKHIQASLASVPPPVYEPAPRQPASSASGPPPALNSRHHQLPHSSTTQPSTASIICINSPPFASQPQAASIIGINSTPICDPILCSQHHEFTRALRASPRQPEFGIPSKQHRALPCLPIPSHPTLSYPVLCCAIRYTISSTTFTPHT